ncbi:MAG: lysine--tRNA ligase [Epsilonproteobacteria bacterium]|nr:lysine--tRNA ligase [Campylobacterota bacterium]
MIFDNQYEQQRIEKSQQLKDLGYAPYPHNIKREASTGEFKKQFAYVIDTEEKRDESKSLSVNGRIKFLRLMGKAAFVKIEDESGQLQIYVARDNLPEGFYNNVFKKLIEVGDIITVTGYPFVTKTGELSLHVTALDLAAKSVKPLPEKFHGLQDIELRYRQRYLDMIMNPDVKDVFKARSKLVSIVRHFFESKGFLEVETPMMHPIAGGANARPFVTHHNALDVERFLRIAPELYLKRLIVGGFEAVFEINRNFRNEGMDHTHNPEFTMIEFYWAYHNYKDLMRLTEELFETLIRELDLPTTINYGDMQIDLSGPFKKIAWADSLSEIGGVPAEIIEDREAMLTYLKEHNCAADPKLSVAKLQTELFDHFVEPKLINPTFITHYPIEISPLARRSDENPEIADRFEFFVAGTEIANGFNELNDPIDQHERFTKQIEDKNSGDDEAHEMDEEYIHALGYGMPPTAGQGIGIDRLVMLLTNQHSIRDVILFPAMKPIKTQENDEEAN